MPKNKVKSTMTWKDAPDIIGIEEIMKILGIGEPAARELFETKNFPKIEGIGNTRKAEKEAVKLFLQGFKIKENSKISLDYMILLELKKLNNKFEEREMDFNEQKAT